MSNLPRSSAVGDTGQYELVEAMRLRPVRGSRSATACDPASGWARSSPASTATGWPRTSRVVRSRARRVVVEQDAGARFPGGDGFFLGVTLLDDVTPNMGHLQGRVFGHVLVGTYNKASSW